MKDYAKTASNKKKSNKNFIIFMSAFIVVILSVIWGGVVLVHKRHQQRQQLMQTAADKKSSKQNKMYHHKKRSIAQPHFDFYHLLSEIKIPMPQRKPAAIVRTQKTYIYFLQISTTKDENAAKYLQQKLQNNEETPLDTQLLNVASSDGSLRYRIMAGPYDDVVVAQRIQNELRLQGRDSLLIKRLVDEPSAKDDNNE